MALDTRDLARIPILICPQERVTLSFSAESSKDPFERLEAAFCPEFSASA
jgi:hypothetical protein